jgi:hypothetical protein
MPPMERRDPPRSPVESVEIAFERGEGLFQLFAVAARTGGLETREDAGTRELERRAALLHGCQPLALLGGHLWHGDTRFPLGPLRVALLLTLELIRVRFELLIEITHTQTIPHSPSTIARCRYRSGYRQPPRSRPTASPTVGEGAEKK